MASRQIIGNLYFKWSLFILFGEIFLTKAHYNAQQYSTNFLPTLTRSHVHSRNILPQHNYHHNYHNLHHYHHQHPLNNNNHHHNRFIQYQQQQTQTLKQQPYLTLPFFNNNNYNGNFHEKPKSLNHDNMIIYNNKRYKRYPPYQAAMPEIPIKKAISRYLPYTPLYQMSLIHAVTPSILIPLYMQPSKTSSSVLTASRLLLKPTQPKIIKPTIATIINDNNINNNNIIPTKDFNNQLFYNYLRLFKINNNNQNSTIATIKSTMPSLPLNSFWDNLYKLNATSTTNTAASNGITNILGNYHVESKIKFIDSPFSASNVRLQRGGDNNDDDNNANHDYNNKNTNSNMATIFHFPIKQEPTTTTTVRPSSTLYQTIPTTPTSNKKISQDQEQQTEEEKNEDQYDFVPTWYPYVKAQQQQQQEQQHKYSNFFTIEDAITPYKPIEPIMNFNSYQPFSYDTVQTENSLAVHGGFSPLQDIYHNSYSLSPLPSFRTTTTTSTTTTNSPATPITPIIELKNRHEEIDRENNEVTTPTWINMDSDLITNSPTMSTKVNSKLHMLTEEEKEIEEPSKNFRARLRSGFLNNNQQAKSIEKIVTTGTATTTTKAITTTSKIPKKKNYSFFDDWFSSVTEGATKNSNFDIITTTATTTLPTIRKTALDNATTTTTAAAVAVTRKEPTIKLPKYNMKMRRTNKANRGKNLSTTQVILATTKASATLMNSQTTGETGMVKKLRKKYTTYKNNRQQPQQQHFTRMENFNLTTATTLTSELKENKKFIKRIKKKIIRLRSTLMPVLKLKNNSIHKTWQKPLEEETEIQTTIATSAKNPNDGQQLTSTTTAIIPVTLITRSTTTSTTTAMPKTRSGNRKRGRYTFNNQQQQSSQLSVDSISKRNSVKAINKQEMNTNNNQHNNKLKSKLRINNSRQRSSHAHSSSTVAPIGSSPTTTTTTSTTWPISLTYDNTFKWPASTSESAIMKIATNNHNIKHEKINNILQNLQISSAVSKQQLESDADVTEFPPLPIEVYFHKMTKASYEQ